MSQATINEHAFEVTRTITIDAPLRLVWRALTDPAQIGQWFGLNANFPDGVAPGALGTFAWEDGHYPVRIERHDPMGDFAFTWGTPEQEIATHNSTTAYFSLSEADGQTTVTVVETGFGELDGGHAKQRATMADNASGWTQELDEFSAYVTEVLAGRQAAADADLGTIVRSVRIQAPQSTVWSALTTPDKIAAWWGHPAVFPGGVRAGATGTFELASTGQLMPIEIIACQPEHTFTFLWGDLDDAEVGASASRIEFIVAVDGEHTIVTVTEYGFMHLSEAERRAAIDANVGGWNKVLGNLVAYVQDGTTVEFE